MTNEQHTPHEGDTTHHCRPDCPSWTDTRTNADLADAALTDAITFNDDGRDPIVFALVGIGRAILAINDTITDDDETIRPFTMNVDTWPTRPNPDHTHMTEQTDDRYSISPDGWVTPNSPKPRQFRPDLTNTEGGQA